MGGLCIIQSPRPSLHLTPPTPPHPQPPTVLADPPERQSVMQPDIQSCRRSSSVISGVHRPVAPPLPASSTLPGKGEQRSSRGPSDHTHTHTVSESLAVTIYLRQHFTSRNRSKPVDRQLAIASQSASLGFSSKMLKEWAPVREPVVSPAAEAELDCDGCFSKCMLIHICSRLFVSR